MKIIFTNHARFELQSRSISEDDVLSAVKSPQQKLSGKKGRVIIQNKYYDNIEKKEMLLRIIGTYSGDNFKVITVYKTSRVKKYWIEGG